MFKRIWQILLRLFETTKMFVISQYANLLLSISIILTIVAIIQLALIIFNPFRLSYHIDDLELSKYSGHPFHGEFEKIAGLYSVYVYLQALNAFFLVMRLLSVFGFSAELSIVLDLMSDAILDFIFFILMFLLVLLLLLKRLLNIFLKIMFGFACIAYFNFGAEAEPFSTISDAMITCISILVADINIDDYSSVSDTGIFIVWVIFYMVTILCFI